MLRYMRANSVPVNSNSTDTSGALTMLLICDCQYATELALVAAQDPPLRRVTCCAVAVEVTNPLVEALSAPVIGEAVPAAPVPVLTAVIVGGAVIGGGITLSR